LFSFLFAFLRKVNCLFLSPRRGGEGIFCHLRRCCSLSPSWKVKEKEKSPPIPFLFSFHRRIFFSLDRLRPLPLPPQLERIAGAWDLRSPFSLSLSPTGRVDGGNLCFNFLEAFLAFSFSLPRRRCNFFFPPLPSL